MPKWILQIVTPLLCGLLLLLGVIAVNSVLRAYFRENQRCTIAFSDIECEPPGKLSRQEFLGEVQYLANWPDEINLLDDGIAGRLHLSFAVHPWVESVQRVQIKPPRQVRVFLRYRTPVLAVSQLDDKASPNRVVDRAGVLLPLAAADAQLPVLSGKIAPPTGHTGQPWGDPGVVAAATIASQLASYQEQIPLKQYKIVDGVLIVSNDRTRILWGELGKDEVPVETKLQALLDVQTKRHSLDGLEIDVRSPEQPLVRPYPRP